MNDPVGVSVCQAFGNLPGVFQNCVERQEFSRCLSPLQQAGKRSTRQEFQRQEVIRTLGIQFKDGGDVGMVQG